MTTIACSQKEIACDLQFTLNNTVITKGKTKIYKVKPHELHCNEEFLVGFAGIASDISDLMDYYTSPDLYKTPPKSRGLTGLALTKSGKIFVFDSPLSWVRIDAKFAAIGSGSQVAYGALHVGATPKEAVEAASKVDVYTGCGIKTLSFT